MTPYVDIYYVSSHQKEVPYQQVSRGIWHVASKEQTSLKELLQEAVST